MTVWLGGKGGPWRTNGNQAKVDCKSFAYRLLSDWLSTSAQIIIGRVYKILTI